MTQEGRAISARSRLARPVIRQLRARDGRASYCRVVACRCGWTVTVAGWRAALAASDQHWRTHRDPRRRPA